MQICVYNRIKAKKRPILNIWQKKMKYILVTITKIDITRKPKQNSYYQRIQFWTIFL